MPSLSNAYEERRRDGPGRRRVVAGTAGFAAGALAVVAGILVLTTPLAALVGVEGALARKELAGTLVGLGGPAAVLGVVTVLPSSRRERAGVVLGTAGTVLGVALFRHAYPTRWVGTPDSLAFEAAMVYFLAGCLALWYVFATLVRFRVRNNPLGTVNLEIRRPGGTETVEVTRDEFRRYRDALVGDGGAEETVIREVDGSDRRNR